VNFTSYPAYAPKPSCHDKRWEEQAG
jgi:hypothetical protein